MADQFVGNHHGRVLDEVGRQLGFAHFGQMRGVGGIVAADDQQQVHRLAQQFFQRILPVLGRPANRVKETEMPVDLVRAVTLDHGGFDPPLHFLGFAAQHGGLIGHADGLQMDVRIKPRRVGALELLQKFLLVPAMDDVIANVVRLLQIINDKIMARAVGGGLGGGGLGFLVLGLAVDDAGDAFLGILADAFPDAHHVAASGVHQFAAFGDEFFLRVHLRAEGGNDDHVPGVQTAQFLLARLGGNDLDAHVANLVIDLRVMDDFAQQINRLGRRERPCARRKPGRWPVPRRNKSRISWPV